MTELAGVPGALSSGSKVAFLPCYGSKATMLTFGPGGGA
jgi:hypothetical protein